MPERFGGKLFPTTSQADIAPPCGLQTVFFNLTGLEQFVDRRQAS
jgi:hypothetical protein